MGVRMQNFEIKYKKPTTILGRDSQGRGQQISGALGREPRGSSARISAKFRKTFFASWSTLSAADDCCGEVSRSNRGSFLVERSNAGAQRAALDELKNASAKAAEGLNVNCPTYQ